MCDTKPLLHDRGLHTHRSAASTAAPRAFSLATTYSQDQSTLTARVRTASSAPGGRNSTSGAAKAVIEDEESW